MLVTSPPPSSLPPPTPPTPPSSLESPAKEPPCNLKRKEPIPDEPVDRHPDPPSPPDPALSVSKGEYESGRIMCDDCGETVSIRDESGAYTSNLWKEHRKTHAPPATQMMVYTAEIASSSSQPPAKRRRAKRTEEERIQYLRSDPYVSKFEAFRVLCKSCEKWIRLRPNSTYCSIPWDAHRKSCLAKKVNSKNIYALEERNTTLAKDPDVRKFDPERVLCNMCDEWLSVSSEDHLQAVQTWVRHRDECQKQNGTTRPPTAGPSSRQDSSPTSADTAPPASPTPLHRDTDPTPRPPLSSASTASATVPIPSFLDLNPANYAPAHESRRRNAEQRAATLRADKLIGQVEPNRVFCSLCQKWVQLRQDSSYCAYPWLQHRGKCLARHQRRAQKAADIAAAKGKKYIGGAGAPSPPSASSSALHGGLQNQTLRHHGPPHPGSDNDLGRLSVDELEFDLDLDLESEDDDDEAMSRGERERDDCSLSHPQSHPLARAYPQQHQRQLHRHPQVKSESTQYRILHSPPSSRHHPYPRHSPDHHPYPRHSPDHRPHHHPYAQHQPHSQSQQSQSQSQHLRHREQEHRQIHPPGRLTNGFEQPLAPLPSSGSSAAGAAPGVAPLVPARSHPHREVHVHLRTSVDVDADTDLDGGMDGDGDGDMDEADRAWDRDRDRTVPLGPGSGCGSVVSVVADEGVDPTCRSRSRGRRGGVIDLDSASGRRAFIALSISHLFSTTYDPMKDDMSISTLLTYLNAAMPVDKHEDFDTSEVVKGVVALEGKGKVRFEGDMVRLGVGVRRDEVR